MNDDRLLISAAGNVEVPAWLVLLEKGYTVTAIGDSSWQAENGQLRCRADSLAELLGVVAMAEARGTGWAATDQQIEAFLRLYGPA